MEVRKIVTPLDSNKDVFLVTLTAQVKFVPVNNDDEAVCLRCCLNEFNNCYDMPCRPILRRDGKKGYFKIV